MSDEPLTLRDVASRFQMSHAWGSKGWDGDPRSCELPSTGVWPDTYASRGRKIEWYGEDPASWSINWWEDLGASATDPTWKFSRGVMSTDAYESPSLSTGSLTNFVEFTFDGEGVFSCEARLNDGGRTSNKYIRLYVDGELLMNVSAQYNQKWQSLDCLVRGDGRHNVRIGFLIPNTKYNGGPTVCSLQNVKWEPRSQGEVAVYDWQIADNGDGTVTLTGVTPEPRYELVIPSEVGGKTVTALGDSLLKDSRFVSVVTVPDTVKIIKPYVFYGCKGLRTVNLPNGLLEIGTYAFFGCSSLAFIELPQSLKTIGAYAFMSSGLESVTLPGGLTSVGEEAFYCSKLASIMIPAGVQNIGYRMLNEDGAIAVVYVEDGDANRVCKMLKSSSIIVSKLTFRTQGVPCSDCYPLSYELNGGVNAISNPDVYDVRDLPLALADPTRKGYDFAGWTLDGQPITSLPADSTGAKTVKATWVVHQVRLDEALNCEGVTITTSGNASWFGQSSVTHDGACAARSGAISGNQSSSMEVSVVGPATVSFWWKVSSESVSYDYLEFKVDGTQRNKIGGTSGSWAFVSVSLGTGTHKLVWKYQKDGSVDAGSDCGWVDELVIMNLPTALNLSGMSVTTDNSSGWTAQKDVTHDGSMAARSGAIGSGQTSSMSIPVTGPAKVAFWWKVSSEYSYDCLSVSLDSSSKGSISGLQEWSQVTIDVPSGSHTITWRYTKDGSVDSGDDCGWVDQVVVSRINVVSFDANGGNPSVADRTYEGEQVYGTLPVVSRRGCRFLGWYTSTTGGTKIVPTMTVTTSLTLYAQWEFEKVDLGIALGVEENSVSTSGYAEWFGQITESHDGSHAARSGKISGGQTSRMDVVVEGPADISFWWKVSSESDIYDYLQFFIDGTAQDKIGGTGGDWAQKSFSIGGGDHILTWSYVKDGSVDKGEDCGWVDDIVITPKTYSITYENVRGGANDNPVSYTAGDSIVFAPLADTTDARFVAWNPERIEKGTTGDKIVTAIWETKVLADLVRGASAVSTDGAQPWCVLWDGSDWLLRSGHIGNNQTSDLSATVRGKGKLLFSWKVNSETHVDRGVTLPYDEATFTVGDVKKELYGDQAWTPVQVDLGEGEHQLTWRFIKDVMDENWVGEDCVWLKDVQWIPDSIIPDLSTLRMLFGDDSDMAAKITTNEALLKFNVFLANCGVTRSDELNDAQKTWAYQSFKLEEITTAPQLFEEEPVLRIDDIEPTGGNLSVTISLTAGAEAITLAKDKLADKIRVGASLDAVVEMPQIVAGPSADGTSLTFTIAQPQGDKGFVRILID